MGCCEGAEQAAVVPAARPAENAVQLGGGVAKPAPGGPGARPADMAAQKEFFDAAMRGDYGKMQSLANRGGIDINSAAMQGKTPLGICCFRGESGQVAFLLDHGARRVGPGMFDAPNPGKRGETSDTWEDMTWVVHHGVEKGRCSQGGKAATLALIEHRRAGGQAGPTNEVLSNGPREPPAGFELQGEWQASRFDSWAWATSYGENASKVRQAFANTGCSVAADGTFNFHYGSITAGKGQWWKEQAADKFFGGSKVTSSTLGAVGWQTKHVVQLLADGTLQLTYTFTNGPAAGKTITEYYSRAATAITALPAVASETGVSRLSPSTAEFQAVIAQWNSTWDTSIWPTVKVKVPPPAIAGVFAVDPRAHKCSYRAKHNELIGAGSTQETQNTALQTLNAFTDSGVHSDFLWMGLGRKCKGNAESRDGGRFRFCNDVPPECPIRRSMEYTREQGGAKPWQWCGWVVKRPPSDWFRISCWVKCVDRVPTAAFGFKLHGALISSFMADLRPNVWRRISAVGPCTGGDGSHVLVFFDAMGQSGQVVRFTDVKLEVFSSAPPPLQAAGSGGNEMSRFHGTRLKCSFNGALCSDPECCACRILEDGKLSIGQVGKMSKEKGYTPGFYGDGLYFTSKSHTAKGYGMAKGKKIPPWDLSDFVSKDAGNAVFVCSVLVGNPQVVSDKTRAPLPRGFHSRVVDKSTGIDELVVFDEAQVLLTHLLVFG